MSIEDVATNGKFPELKGVLPGDQVVLTDKHAASVDNADDAQLFALATERMKSYNPSKVRSFSEIKEKYGITDDDLEGCDAVIE